MELTDYDRTRYTRQILLDNWGEQGQARLKAARVFIAGAGGLGSAVAACLTEAGVGTLRICDRDSVELSNLNRQTLHVDSRIGMSKAASAGQTLKELNPSITVETVAETITAGTVASIIGTPDLMVDCLDNFEGRYVLNEYCCAKGIPLVHGGLWGWSGQVTFIHPPQTPCLKCIFPHSAPHAVIPVVGVAAGLVGSLQAMEALRYLLGMNPQSLGKMIVIDGEQLTMQSLPLKRSPKCRVCGNLPSKNI